MTKTKIVSNFESDRDLNIAGDLRKFTLSVSQSMDLFDILPCVSD